MDVTKSISIKVPTVKYGNVDFFSCVKVSDSDLGSQELSDIHTKMDEARAKGVCLSQLDAKLMKLNEIAWVHAVGNIVYDMRELLADEKVAQAVAGLTVQRTLRGLK